MSESKPNEATHRTEKRSCAMPMLIGCGTALVAAVVIASVMAFLSGQFWDFYADQTRRLRAEEEFAENWDAPDDTATVKDFSPESVAGYELTGTDNQAEFPALGIQADGEHAIYEDGSSQIDVTVYRMNEQKKEVVFDEVERRVNDDERFPNHALTRRPHVLDFQVASPRLAGRFWYGQGWLIFVRSHSVRDIAAFSRAYLEAVGGDGGSGEAGAGEN